MATIAHRFRGVCPAKRQGRRAPGRGRPLDDPPPPRAPAGIAFPARRIVIEAIAAQTARAISSVATQ